MRDNLCRTEVAPGCKSGADCESGICNTATGTCTPGVCGDGIVNAAAGEVCDTALESCCDASCTALAAAGVECRAAVGPCDRAELCDGASAACPADELAPRDTVCRAAAADCDAAERCDGTSASCPADEAAPDGGECDDCAAGAGLCDRCTGGVCTSLCGNGVVDGAAGEQCDSGADAACPGHCGQSCTCAFASTCLGYKDVVPDLSDGRYVIDPDGAGGLEPFDVSCDMTTDGGGWTVIEYASDLPFGQQFNDSDIRRYLPQDFALTLGSEQIAAIQAHAAEGFQRYVGLCEHVIHYFYTVNEEYNFAFGFRFLDGTETPSGVQSYAPFDITVPQDGCINNGGEGGDPAQATIFDIRSPLVPVVNVSSQDNGGTGEAFGSPLTQNPALLR